MIVVLPIRRRENALPRLNSFLGKFANEYAEHRIKHNGAVDLNYLYESVGKLHPALEIHYDSNVSYQVFVFENQDQRVYFLGYFPHYENGLRDNKLHIDYLNFCAGLYALGGTVNILPLMGADRPLDTYITYYNNSELSHGKVYIATVGEGDEVGLLEFISKLATENNEHRVDHTGRMRGLGIREVVWPDVEIDGQVSYKVSYDFWEEVAVNDSDTAEMIAAKFEGKTEDMASRKAIDVISMYCKHDPTVHHAFKNADREEKGVEFPFETPWNVYTSENATRGL